MRPIVRTMRGRVELSIGSEMDSLDPLDAIRLALDLYRAGMSGCRVLADQDRVYNELRKVITCPRD